MATPQGEAFNVLVPPPVQVEVEKLAGRRAGSGPLEPVVCGVHLNRGYRLAFTTQPPLVPEEDDRRVVVVLYVGKREPGHRGDDDVWDVVHDLFGVHNPPAGHDKPRCCEGDLPEIDDKQLDEFLRTLRRLQRGR